MKEPIVLKGRIIDGNGGPPLEKGIVALNGSRITAVCREAEYPVPENVKVISLEDATILPGFIEQHVHIGMGSINHQSLYSMHPYEKVCHAINDLEQLLDAGFTTIRDCGGISNHLKHAASVGYFKSPRIFAAGRCLTQTGGHFDMIKNFPIEFNEKGNILATICDGKTEVRKGCRMNFREGADFIKCMVSPGVVSQSKSLNTREFADEELQAMVEEADKMGTYVAAHAISNAGIKSAIRCGVQSIEHGYFATEEDIEQMAKKGLWLFPTLGIAECFMESIRTGMNRQALSEWLIQKMPQAYEQQEITLRMARKAGVKVGFGTDMVGDRDVGPFGTNGIEFKLLCRRGGYTPMEAICMATRFGREVVNNCEIGTLEVGKLADIVIVKGNPLENIDLLAYADNIKIVLLGGEIKKNLL